MIRELRTLVAVARRGSFAAAGEQVGLTQSAVSAQIRALERSVGVELFKRTPRAAHLNEVGRQAVRTAEQILALFDGIGQGDSPRGRLRIGAVNTAQTGLLPEVLKRLAEQAPHIEPQVMPGVSLHLLDQVDAAELDLAILIRPPFNLPRGLSAQRVERQPFVLIAPPQCTATDALELLRTQPFIRYDHVSFGGRLVGDFLEAQQLRPRQVMELDEIDDRADGGERSRRGAAAPGRAVATRAGAGTGDRTGRAGIPARAGDGQPQRFGAGRPGR